MTRYELHVRLSKNGDYHVWKRYRIRSNAEKTRDRFKRRKDHGAYIKVIS